MALKSGLAGQFGFVTEDTPGVAKTPTMFLPFIDESIQLTRPPIESEAIYAGRRTMDSEQWAPGAISVGGDIGMELYSKGTSTLFRHCFGGKATGSLGGGRYRHTYTPGDLSGLTACAQIGVPSTVAGVYPKTASGLKVSSWELGVVAGEFATFGMSFLGMKLQLGSRVVTDAATTNGSAVVSSSSGALTDADVGKSLSGTGIPTGAYLLRRNSSTEFVMSANATATGTGVSVTIGLPLASVTQPDLVPFTFRHGAILLGGSAARVKSATLTGDNAVSSDDRLFIGSSTYDEALETDRRSYGGQLEVEFENATQYDRFMAGTEVALVLSFTQGDDSLTITKNVRYDEAAVNVGGRGIVGQSLPVTGLGGTDAATITAVLENTDSSAD
jgi:hypothetical protein